MKNRFLFLVIPLIFVLSACSWDGGDREEPQDKAANQNQEIDLVEDLPLASTTLEEADLEDTLFSYEYPDLGIKLTYPGTCYFNKGMIDCGDFTLSVWPLEKPTAAEAQKTFKDGYTQIEYGYSNNDNNYALMAWYEGEDKADLEVAIAEIAETLVFTN